MRNLPTALGLIGFGLSLGLTGAAFQQDEEEPDEADKKAQEIIDSLAPFTAYRESEAVRLEEEIIGAWMLHRFETPSLTLTANEIDGFVVFHDGFMALVIQGESKYETWFDYAQDRYTLQAGIFRYRFSEQLTLQTSSIMGFAMPNEVDLIFERFNEPREYLLTLDEYELRLNHPDGYWFVFQKMDRGEFPEETLRALDSLRLGAEDIFQPERDRGQFR